MIMTSNQIDVFLNSNLMSWNRVICYYFKHRCVTFNSVIYSNSTSFFKILICAPGSDESRSGQLCWIHQTLQIQRNQGPTSFQTTYSKIKTVLRSFNQSLNIFKILLVIESNQIKVYTKKFLNVRKFKILLSLKII